MNVGFLLCSTKKKNPLSIVFSFTTIFLLVWSSGTDMNEQWTNIINYFTIRDPSENIGIYFFVSIEVFKNHREFFKYAYLIGTFVILWQIRGVIRRGYALVAMCSQHDVKKYERRIYRLKCNTIFLVVFVKIALN